MESLGGSLLVAGPSLWDPNFRRAVVLVGHHDDAGAVGVVLNRATEVDVVDAAPPLATLVGLGERVFVGGPVQPQSAVVVADFERPELAEVIAFGSIGFLPDGVDAERIGPLRRARVFAGYAGWGAGQLAGEVEEGSWYVVTSEAADAFRDDPSELWRDVMRRQPGMLAWHVNRPFDHDLN